MKILSGIHLTVTSLIAKTYLNNFLQQNLKTQNRASTRKSTFILSQKWRFIILYSPSFSPSISYSIISAPFSLSNMKGLFWVFETLMGIDLEKVKCGIVKGPSVDIKFFFLFKITRWMNELWSNVIFTYICTEYI